MLTVPAASLACTCPACAETRKSISRLPESRPPWFSMFDTDGPQAEATRRAFFDRVIAEKGIIAGYHFGFPNVGTLSKDGNGYAFAAAKA